MTYDLKFVFCTMVILLATGLRMLDKVSDIIWADVAFWTVMGYVLGVAVVKVADGWSTQAVAKANVALVEAKTRAQFGVPEPG